MGVAIGERETLLERKRVERENGWGERGILKGERNMRIVPVHRRVPAPTNRGCIIHSLGYSRNCATFVVCLPAVCQNNIANVKVSSRTGEMRFTSKLSRLRFCSLYVHLHIPAKPKEFSVDSKASPCGAIKTATLPKNSSIWKNYVLSFFFPFVKEADKHANTFVQFKSKFW